MLILTLLRHAKAEGHGRVEDFDRALTDRGKSEAAQLGDYLREIKPLPDLALVSSSKRTTQTFKVVAKHLRSTIPVRFEDGLFTATTTQLRQALGAIPASVGHLLIVGHNPAIADTAIDLAADLPERSGDLARMRERFPPCALARLSFTVGSWAEASAGGGHLDAFVMPEDLAGR